MLVPGGRRGGGGLVVVGVLWGGGVGCGGSLALKHLWESNTHK